MAKKRMGFRERKAYWANRERVDNSKLPAGSPVFYYCKLCGAEITMSEIHVAPAPLFCPDCIVDGYARTHYDVSKRNRGASKRNRRRAR